MFEQAFKNIDDVLWKEAGCTTELDYTEQTSWLLFLKYLDDLEQEKAMEAELRGKSYEYIVDESHRWSSWAAPKRADGTYDHDDALTGDDLIRREFAHFSPFGRIARTIVLVMRQTRAWTRAESATGPRGSARPLHTPGIGASRCLFPGECTNERIATRNRARQGRP